CPQLDLIESGVRQSMREQRFGLFDEPHVLFGRGELHLVELRFVELPRRRGVVVRRRTIGRVKCVAEVPSAGPAGVVTVTAGNGSSRRTRPPSSRLVLYLARASTSTTFSWV